VRPLLFTLTYDAKTALGFFLAFAVVTFVVAKRGLPLGRALAATALASLTCGMLGGRSSRDAKEGPDLFITGALATMTGLLPLAAVLSLGRSFDVPVASYPLAMAVGFLACILYVLRRCKSVGLDSAHVLDLAIICLIAGPVGSRIFFVAQFWDDYFADRPARLVIGAVAPLTSSDELLVTASDGSGFETTAVTFSGTETTLEQVEERVRNAHLHTHLVTLDRRKQGSEIVHQVRGVSIESETRGDSATLEASGSAAEKLGLTEPGRGRTIPLGDTLKIWNGGMVFYGGLIFAALACVAYIRFRRYSLALLADLIAPVLPLGMAFGRIGCTLNGCCWGREVEASFPLAVRFPVLSHPWFQHARAALDASWDAFLDQGTGCPEPLANKDLATGSHPVHPVQIYSSVTNFCLFFFLLWFGRRMSRRQGQTFFAFLMIEPVCRFVIETFRGDNAQFFTLAGWPLSMGQVVALATLPVAAIGFLLVSKYGQVVRREGSEGKLGETHLSTPTTDQSVPG
jgi:phosphatidylglycerol:prolipoprotein diacylglycerol transferase